jgi:hypothetical protein
LEENPKYFRGKEFDQEEKIREEYFIRNLDELMILVQPKRCRDKEFLLL